MQIQEIQANGVIGIYLLEYQHKCQLNRITTASKTFTIITKFRSRFKRLGLMALFVLILIILVTYRPEVVYQELHKNVDAKRTIVRANQSTIFWRQMPGLREWHAWAL